MRFSKSLLLSAAILVLPFVGQAASVKSDPTLTLADLTFSDFSCAVTHEGAAGPSNCGKIDVHTITNPATGIQFASGFIAASAGNNTAFDDATINYHVTSLAGINNVGLDFNGTFYGWAISSVTETIKDASNNIVGFAQVTCGPTDMGGCIRSTSIALNGLYNDLYITKDINVSAFLGVSQISYINQTFDPTPTPEPASFAMLGVGLIGAAGLLRRRAKASAKA